MKIVIMWKTVKLKGYGAGPTTISVFNAQVEKLQYWRDHVRMLYENNLTSLVYGQKVAFGDIEPDTLKYLSQ